MSGQSLAYICIGSNIAPAVHLFDAVAMLSGCCQLLAVSHVWESSPVGSVRQLPFLNAAVLVRTAHGAASLRSEVLRPIERALGRRRAWDEKNAPRTVDLDLVLFDSEVIEGDGWRVPDPAILKHNFLAIPLAELDPEYIHPTVHRCLGEIAHSLFGNRPSIKLRPELRLSPYCAPSLKFIRSLPAQMLELRNRSLLQLVEYLPW